MRVFGISGWKDSGKTTLVVALVTEFCRRGLRVSTVKHAHHEFDVDQPGRDSYRHRQAGAGEVLVASARRWALMHEVGSSVEPELAELLGKLAPVDLVLVEGFKQEQHPKLQVIAPGAETQSSRQQIAGLRAYACADPERAPEFTAGQVVLARDDVAGIADFILDNAQCWP